MKTDSETEKNAPTQTERVSDCGDSSCYPKKFTHRGVGFHLTHKGIWAFDAIPPCHPYAWYAYEREGDENKDSEQYMKTLIDRCLG